MSVDAKVLYDVNTIKEYSQSVAEPDWMLELRLKAFQLYPTLPFPKLEKTKIDKWNIDRFIPFKKEPEVSNISELPQQISALFEDGQERNLIIQKNSSAVYKEISEHLKNLGVVFTDLQSALREHGDLLQKYFMKKAFKADENKLTSLHTALWSGGIFIHVPRNTEVKVPLQGLFWAADEGVALFPHVIIIAEENSSITYVDNHISTSHSDERVQNGIVEIFVAQGAKVRYASVRTLDKHVTDYTFRRAVVERDGKVEWIIGDMNDGNGVAENASILEGDGGCADSKFVSIGTGNQKLHLTSRAVHIGTHTESEILAKVVMHDEATAIVNGITVIEKGAQKANGEQSESVLMLSEKARGDANPILLIDEDDVKAGHAASVGQIDPIQIFYLMSRGISRKDAERLVIRGFLSPVVSEIPLDGIKKRLMEAIERKLNR